MDTQVKILARKDPNKSPSNGDRQVKSKNTKTKPVRDIENFTLAINMMGGLITDGYSPGQVIEIMCEEGIDAGEKDKMSIAFKEVNEHINAGMSVSKAFETTDFFPHELCSILTVGERTGRMGLALKLYSDYLRNVVRMKRNINASLYYPSFIISFAIVGLLGIFLFVVPKMLSSFSSYHVDTSLLPWYSNALMSISKGVNHIPIFILVPGTCIFLYYMLFGKGRSHMEKLISAIPFVARIYHRLSWAQWLFLGAICTESGMTTPDMLKSLQVGDLPKELKKDNVYSNLEKNVKAGHSFPTELRKAGAPALITSMIRLGEKNAKMGEAMKNIARQYLSGVETQSKAVGAAVEPVIIAFITGSVGVPIACLMLTMYKITSLIGS